MVRQGLPDGPVRTLPFPGSYLPKPGRASPRLLFLSPAQIGAKFLIPWTPFLRQDADGENLGNLDNHA
ncbi:hypothetical protein FBZ88_10870 [Nitrospirillum bahiense]|uniref:Uncharacterized protein n=1 Tax=Nitrospirillum amazonense TaxID=28077 RepID=A0A560FXE1_9PROT|nr:hypothetical protein FBZ88_10870 [Nitrospirillum amazonense]